jgi:hypothetical protein
VVDEVPRIADLAVPLSAAVECAARHGVTLVSFHTPPCALPLELRAIFAPARELSLAVVGPDGRPFALEDSSFEGGAFTESCAGCAERGRCGGPRADYVKIHGDAEFVALVTPKGS